MNTPHLNRRLVLEAPQRVDDGAGGFVTSWTALGTLWADIAPGTGQETRGATAPMSRVPYKITLRAAPPGSPARPLPNQRLREGERIFAILAVAEADRAGRYLVLQAEEEVVK